MIIKPNIREFFARVIIPIIAWLAGIILRETFLKTYASVMLSIEGLLTLIILVYVCGTYISIYSTKWAIDKEVISRTHGILAKRKDYIELYRVVDYAETQTFTQLLFSVKTVIIMSTDKSDSEMAIWGIPKKNDVIAQIRNKVEQCKKEKRIYEITNR